MERGSRPTPHTWTCGSGARLNRLGVASATTPSALDASKLDAEQDKDLKRRKSRIEKNYKDAYAPKVMPEHQQMADDLKRKSGKDYGRTFYQDVFAHHQEAIKTIDDYLPKARDATIKQMAEKMKATQAREIAELQQKVDKLGS